MLFFGQFYVTSESLNTISAVFWFFVDCFTFSYLFIYFTLTFLAQTLVSKLYIAFWTPQLKDHGPSVHKTSIQSSNYLRLPKHLQKYTLYTYLKQSGQQRVDLTTFFTPNQSNNGTDARVLRQLYQTIGALKGSGALTTQLSLTTLVHGSLTQETTTENKVGVWASNNSSLTAHTNLLLNYFLLMRGNRGTMLLGQPSPTDLTSLNRWNLYTVTPETALKGNFYVNELNLNTLNHLSAKAEYTMLWSDAVREVVRSTKSQYWLYRYSTLHRAVFKNVHTLTVTKRLIGSGFFDSKLVERNLWAANELQSASNYSAFQEQNKATMELLYNSSRNLTDTLSISNAPNTSSTDLRSLALYQKSFDWFLTRSYHFSGLQSSLLSSGYKLASTTVTSKAAEDRQNKLRLSLTPYLRALSLSNNIYVGQSNVPSLSFGPTSEGISLVTPLTPSYTNRDLYLFYSSQSAYNISTLQVLTSLLQRRTSQSKQFHYPTTGTLFAQNNLDVRAFDTSLHPTLVKPFRNNLTPRLVSLEALFLQDLASSTMYSQK